MQNHSIHCLSKHTPDHCKLPFLQSFLQNRYTDLGKFQILFSFLSKPAWHYITPIPYFCLYSSSPTRSHGPLTSSKDILWSLECYELNTQLFLFIFLLKYGLVTILFKSQVCFPWDTVKKNMSWFEIRLDKKSWRKRKNQS